MKTEEIRMTLSIIEMKKIKAIITLKSARAVPFIAKVKDFDYKGGGETKVILKRCEETVFPNDTDDNRQENYILALKDIKHVDFFSVDSARFDGDFLAAAFCAGYAMGRYKRRIAPLAAVV